MSRKCFDKVENRPSISTDTLCEVFGVTRVTINNWEKQGLKKVKFGWWAIKDIIDFKTLQIHGKNKSDKDLGDKDLKLHFEAKLKEAQHLHQQIKNDALLGEYILKDKAIEEVSRLFITFKNSALALSKTVAIEVSPYLDEKQTLEIEKKVSEVIKKSLTNFSGGIFE